MRPRLINAAATAVAVGSFATTTLAGSGVENNSIAEAVAVSVTAELSQRFDSTQLVRMDASFVASSIGESFIIGYLTWFDSNHVRITGPEIEVTISDEKQSRFLVQKLASALVSLSPLS